MRKNRLYAGLIAAGVLAMAVLAGCGQKQDAQTQSAETVTAQTTAENGTGKEEAANGSVLKGEIEIVTNAGEVTFNAVNEILQKFMKENPDVKITYTTQGSDYEQLMKARMASNDLPDIFATHGWSVARYSEYLRPLNDQSWFTNVEPSFLRNIENENGEIFVLPFNMDQGGIIYNKTLLKELGIDIPQTWAEFMTACGLAKEKGWTGVFLAGKDSRQPANLLDIAATTYLISCEDKGYASQLHNGDFDWNNWAPVSQLLMDLKVNGYLNADSVTCDPVDIPSRMADNDVLFLVSTSPDLIEQAQEINPEALYGIAPIPALTADYKPAFCGGEREAYGIWKDTKNEELCLAVLDYMAQPENIKAICETSKKRSAMKDINPDLGIVAQDYETYADVAIYPIVDRVYLPNGMWSTLKTIGSAIIGDEMTVEESIDIMKEDYETLRSQR